MRLVFILTFESLSMCEARSAVSGRFDKRRMRAGLLPLPILSLISKLETSKQILTRLLHILLRLDMIQIFWAYL